MDFVPIDLLTVLIAALLSIVIGFFWYSKWLFGPMRRELSDGKKRKGMAVFYEFLVSLVIAYFLAFFEGYLGVATVVDGILIGFCVWLGFVATTQISSVIWFKESFRLFLLDTSYKLLSFLVMGGVIGA